MLGILLVLTSSLAVTPAQIEAIAALAEDCVHKPYPNAILHQLKSDADARTPRDLYPAFYGCYDWHSAVHGHWLLARVAHLYPDTAMAERARKLLDISLSEENLRGELAYLQDHPAFERPYGQAWLLQLGAELRQWTDPQAQTWSQRLRPLEAHAAGVLGRWLDKSSLPVRTGTHSQTAFALGLARDWALTAEDKALLNKIDDASRRFFLQDVDYPAEYEPSAHDFLSGALAEADLMRRVLSADEFSAWFTAFLPGLGEQASLLTPAIVSDPTDGHIVHLDGLNLSRAWMMRNIAEALPQDDPNVALLHDSSERHRAAGLASVVDPHYAGGHWLGTFAIYLVTDRGL